MKKLLVLLALCVATTAFAGGESEVKKVCHDKTDAKGAVVKGKDGKVVQACKDVKIHKKLEGTKVPEKK